MKRLIILLLLTTMLSCSTQNPSEQINHLAGYWEITQVEFPDGSLREFGISRTIDYITLNEDGGVRLKVDPKLDGSFVTSGKAEEFKLIIEGDKLRMHYKTPYDSWVETVISTKDSLLVVKNRDDKIYTYKVFKQFEL
ncbi:MAG: hypothetical protein ACI86C_001097 [Candidatus Latescibacterota bacterium]|jgi:hypothetical protein